MIVLAMTDCPPRLRGDISKWLCEINTGVYVGNVSARVREELWSRVCKNLKNGRATLVYSSNGEQKMEFRVHNTSWTPVDFDGITLMRRPLPQAAEPAEELKPGFSKAAKRQMAQRRSAASQQKRDCFVVIDLETGVPWNGRLYRPEDFASGDLVNQALSAGHACLYGLAHAVIVALGCAPGLGFVHVGQEGSFVYDVADLYKAEVTIPIAFRTAAEAPEDLPAVVRRRVRDAMVAQHILERMVHDIR